MVVVVLVVCARPRCLEVPDQSWDLGVEAADVGRDRASEPVRVAEVGDFKGSQLGEEPGDDEGDCGGHDESGWAAEGGFAQGFQGCWNVARLCLAERLDGAHVSGEKGEHGDTNTALEGQTDKREL